MKKFFIMMLIGCIAINLYGEIKSYTVDLILSPDSFAFVPFNYGRDSIPEYVGYDVYNSRMSQEEKEAREHFALAINPFPISADYWHKGEVCRKEDGVFVLLPMDCMSIDTVTWTVLDRKLFSTGYKFPHGDMPWYLSPDDYTADGMYPDSIYEEYIRPDHPSRINRDYGFYSYRLNVCPFYFDAFKQEVYVSSFRITIYYETGEVLWKPENKSGWSVRLCYNFKDRDNLYNEEIFKELTGINHNHYMPSTVTPVYDLQGRRVTHPKMGEIYIQKRKKIRRSD